MEIMEAFDGICGFFTLLFAGTDHLL